MESPPLSADAKRLLRKPEPGLLSGATPEHSFLTRFLHQFLGFARGFVRFIGTLFTIGFSVLPLAAMLVALPAVSPNEAVLTDSIRPARSWFRRTARRVFAVLAGLVVLVALFAFSIEVISRLPLPEGGQLGTLAKKVLGFACSDFMPDDPAPADFPKDKQWLTPDELLEKQQGLQDAVARPNADPLQRSDNEKELTLVNRELEERTPRSLKLVVMRNPKLSPILAKPLWTLLPPTLVQHWPFVLLLVYISDLGLLMLIGKVPLAYNLRYLWVRRRDTLLTAVVFTVVVALVVVLLAFVNGMYKLNESTGIPGNVLVLSEGSTDELFSNLSYNDVNNVERIVVTEDEKNRPLPKPTGVQQVTPGPDGKPLIGADGHVVPLAADVPQAIKEKAPYLASYETYLVMNQPVPTQPGEPQRRRFLQVRAMKDVHLAAAVHNIDIYPGGKWFNDQSVEQRDGKTYLACTIGEGVASTLGPDVGKARLEVGDTFELGDDKWWITGIMKTQGTTYGSEVWTGVNNTVVTGTGKGNKYTTLVLRMAENTVAASRGMAYFLQYRYDQVKLKAYSEPDYYQELTKTNEQFLICIVMLAGVMAVGGVFGVMNTMFASIAARIKEVGVLRILGFKRWQILISFMIESLLIAAVGGALGCLVGLLANFFEASSSLSGGNGGGKTVSLKFIVDYQTLAAGMLFTLVMGRLGGLVPALSAMRMEILESLR
jgi:ABC-type lipoprotein release transport system permease subunit